jgi:hypothetical protein
VATLEGLAEVPRFNMAVMFLTTKQKAELKVLLPILLRHEAFATAMCTSLVAPYLLRLTCCASLIVHHLL